jgi:hypothetical protein
MSTELERRLRRAFGALPAPGEGVTARARAASLATLSPAPRRRGRHLLVAVAAAGVAVALGAAALAATGNLRVDLGARPRGVAPAPARLVVPAGTNGIALVAGGRLWLVTRHGLRIEGMAVSAAELSPRALYAALGIGSSLVALAPGQRRAWTQETHGRVVAAAWSPDGLKIAYVVRRGASAQLRLIEGDGDHDRLLDARVALVKPWWRADSLAVTYVRAGGRLATFDLARGGRVLWARRVRLTRPVRASVPAPHGGGVALALPRPGGIVELRLAGRRSRRPGAAQLLLRVHARPSPLAISWR